MAVLWCWEPSRMTYLVGAGVSLALWVIFLLVPLPGAEVTETTGLLTKATEVVAATACTVLWFRPRGIDQPSRDES